MKLFFNTLVLLAVAVQGALTGRVAEAPANAVNLQARDGDWQCDGYWDDDKRRRLSFTFHGYCVETWGRCFLDKMRARGLQVHNWQAWDRGDGDGWWQVDFSLKPGLAWKANNAIEDVTGIWRGCWNNQ